MKFHTRTLACLLLLGSSACKEEENGDRISVGEGGDGGTTGGTTSTGGAASGGVTETGGVASGGATETGGAASGGFSDGSDLFYLIINVNQSGRGRIVDSMTGWECPSATRRCEISTVPGPDFTLVAEPLEGFVFSGWTDDSCLPSGTGSCVVDASQAGVVELSATFDPE